MTVETAALAQQQIEQQELETIASVPELAPRVKRRKQIAFVAILGVVEASWVILLVELVRLVL
jgi:hypothetical protein